MTIIVAAITLFCLSGDIQIIFTHLYYIPIILASYWFERKGVLFTLFLSLFYLEAVYSFNPADMQGLYSAIIRVIVFIGISLVIAFLSATIKKKQENVSRSERLFHAVWESIHAGIVLVDAKTHCIISANPEFTRMTGFSESDLDGQVCHEYICPMGVGECPVSDKGLKVEHVEGVLLSKDKKEIPVFKTIAEMKIGDEDYYIESCIDITALKDAENILLAYLREATLRIRNPLELVRENLIELQKEQEDRETNPAYITTAIAVQQKNIEGILGNLREIERAVAENRTEIPDALREYLKR
ncbi:PAS domain S-box protein [Methanolacinia petrolearia]|uniref:PAS domain S-box protein n=1 Tax=Methanolacinia petrolearia TaxID=54120 RepID=UPI001651175E|nr:PAS domain S-box protein [Methanolacinia petrolearia]